MTITEEEREQMNDRDSEEPDSDDKNDYADERDSELLEDRYRQVDPELDQKIRAIREGQHINTMPAFQ